MNRAPRRAAPIVDSGIERAWIAALIADPSRHDSSTVSLQDLADPHARAAFIAFANVRERGEIPTKESVRAELESSHEMKANPRPGERADLGWFDALTSTPVAIDAPVAGWENTILKKAEERAKLIAKADAKIDEQNEINDVALRNAEPPPPRPKQKPKRRPRSRIEITTDVADVVDQAQQGLLEGGGIYVRGQMLVHIVHNFCALKWLKVPSGLPMICKIVEPRLWEMMSSVSEHAA